MGFISLFSNKEQVEAFKNQVAKIPDFKLSKEYYACDNSAAIAVDETGAKIALGHNKFTNLQERLTMKPPKGVPLGEYFKENAWDVRLYNYQDIISSEIIEDGNSISQTCRVNQVASTIVGSILMGGTGAIIGGLSAKKKNINTVSRVELSIVVNDLERPRYSIVIFNHIIAKDNFLYRHNMEGVNQINALLSVLIKRADLECESKNPQVAETPSLSIADELTKLSNLLKDGCISKEEFDILKIKLINR